jgi:hypothetical protein
MRRIEREDCQNNLRNINKKGEVTMVTGKEMEKPEQATT